MNKNKDPRLRLIILILILANVVIVREAYVFSEKLYDLLLVTVPMLFYFLFKGYRRRRGNQSFY